VLLLTRCLLWETLLTQTYGLKRFLFNCVTDGSSIAFAYVNTAAIPGPGEGGMQILVTFVTVVAGLVFSVAVGLVAEEFIFGQLIRIFFVRNRVAVSSGQRH
jgi:hypothetical protein